MIRPFKSLPGNIIFFVFLMVGILIPGASGNVLKVAMTRPDAQFKTISDAVRAARPYDTILVYREKNYPFFLEHIVIDKPIRIISEAAAGDIEDFNYYPTLLATSHPEIILISSPGVELIGFNITGPGKQMNPDDRTFQGQIGVRLKYPALIRLCTITGCGTGILARYGTDVKKTGSRIEQCRIGLAPDTEINPHAIIRWKNDFGIILLGISEGGQSIHDHIENCKIMNNRWYGLVYTVASEPVLKDTILDLNGKRPFRVAGSLRKNRLYWFDEPTHPPTGTSVSPSMHPVSGELERHQE